MCDLSEIIFAFLSSKREKAKYAISRQYKAKMRNINEAPNGGMQNELKGNKSYEI